MLVLIQSLRSSSTELPFFLTCSQRLTDIPNETYFLLILRMRGGRFQTEFGFVAARRKLLWLSHFTRLLSMGSYFPTLFTLFNDGRNRDREKTWLNLY